MPSGAEGLVSTGAAPSRGRIGSSAAITIENRCYAIQGWPGHDYGCRPASSIGLEKRTNPFLLCEDLGAFLKLKTGWAEYKRRNGLV